MGNPEMHIQADCCVLDKPGPVLPGKTVGLLSVLNPAALPEHCLGRESLFSDHAPSCLHTLAPPGTWGDVSTLAHLPRPGVLNQGQFCLPGDMRGSLETFLIVTTRRLLLAPSE